MGYFLFSTCFFSLLLSFHTYSQSHCLSSMSSPFCPHISFSVSGTTPSPVVLRPAGRRGVGQGWAMQKILFDDREGSFCSLILLSTLTQFKPKWSSKGAQPQWAHSSLWSHRQCKGIPSSNSPAAQPMLNWKVEGSSRSGSVSSRWVSTPSHQGLLHCFTCFIKVVSAWEHIGSLQLNWSMCYLCRQRKL